MINWNSVVGPGFGFIIKSVICIMGMLLPFSWVPYNSLLYHVTLHLSWRLFPFVSRHRLISSSLILICIIGLQISDFDRGSLVLYCYKYLIASLKIVNNYLIQKECYQIFRDGNMFSVIGVIKLNFDHYGVIKG